MKDLPASHPLYGSEQSKSGFGISYQFAIKCPVFVSRIQCLQGFAGFVSYSHSMVKNYLQFVPVCRSLFYLHPVSKNDEIPWGQIWVTDFGAGQGDTMGHGGSRRMGGASCVISSTGKPMSYLEV